MRRFLVVALIGIVAVPIAFGTVTGATALSTSVLVAAFLAWACVALWWRLVVLPSEHAAADRALALEIQRYLYAPLSPLYEATPGYSVTREVTVGELVRNFNQETSGSIAGWIDYRLGFKGWGVGVQAGRLGLGTGSLGLSGLSQVHLSLSSTTRADLVSDGWMAVLEAPTAGGVPDMMRLVVPSEAAVNELLGGLASSVAEACGTVLPRSSRMIIECSRALCAPGRTNISYVGDRLMALTRLPADRRPPVTVIGVQLADHTVLGGALRFGTEDGVHQLVPLLLIERWLRLPGARAQSVGP